MLDVSAPTVSKWRNGKAQVPMPTLVFLTLILAHLIEDAEALEKRFDGIGDRSGFWNSTLDEQLSTMRRFLHEQEVFTSTLPAEVVHAGARLYRDWLHANNSISHSMQASESAVWPDASRG